MMEEVLRVPVRRQGPDTIEALFRAEYVPMVRLAYTLVGNNAEAEELVQDSFAEVHRRRDEIRQPGAYLRTSVVSRSRSLLRRRSTEVTSPGHLGARISGGRRGCHRGTELRSVLR